jgi:hypothetical protein
VDWIVAKLEVLNWLFVSLDISHIALITVFVIRATLALANSSMLNTAVYLKINSDKFFIFFCVLSI